ncbi:hypothetical protein [Actinoplanes sp. GCM10030250]|uniref:hypothetical protein n=1 Tax=Actinoplanes sp. GCM10030250 TaxID=3273376 RepID=UPI00361F5F0A
MLTVRDVTFWDIRSVAEVLSVTTLDTALGHWLGPDPVTRGRHLYDFYQARVVEAIQHGTARVADEPGEVVAAALWLPCSTDSTRHPAAARGEDGFHRRLDQLGTARNEPRLSQPHLRLVGLGVLARWRSHRVAIQLLTEPEPAPLLPARCVTAVDGPLAVLCARCGYRPHGAPVLLAAGGAITQTMLYSPELSIPGRRNTSARRYRAGSARVTNHGGGTVGIRGSREDRR